MSKPLAKCLKFCGRKLRPEKYLVENSWEKSVVEIKIGSGN
jgi:hypothetical protein